MTALQQWEPQNDGLTMADADAILTDAGIPWRMGHMTRIFTRIKTRERNLSNGITEMLAWAEDFADAGLVPHRVTLNDIARAAKRYHRTVYPLRHEPPCSTDIIQLVHATMDRREQGIDYDRIIDHAGIDGNDVRLCIDAKKNLRARVRTGTHRDDLPRLAGRIAQARTVAAIGGE